ncbi:hypothetical protein V7S43_002124 [Phytophthora oleae]|uniref:Uncharacterized protein n=1 Tax=Phytophthora oleae TaxID=2107226 RepID=A0ABD3G4G6_9STRA
MKNVLKTQSDHEWTVVSIGWVMGYSIDIIVPSINRYHPDIGPWFALVRRKPLTIAGTGNDVFAITSALDVTKATAELLKSRIKWCHFTFMQGTESMWLQFPVEVISFSIEVH